MPDLDGPASDIDTELHGSESGIYHLLTKSLLGQLLGHIFDEETENDRPVSVSVTT